MLKVARFDVEGAAFCERGPFWLTQMIPYHSGHASSLRLFAWVSKPQRSARNPLFGLTKAILSMRHYPPI